MNDIPNRDPDEIDSEGSKIWNLGGNRKFKIRPNGIQKWYLNDELHREDGPAIIDIDGTTEWFFDGERHREDGPAIEYGDGSTEWWLHGEMHREDGPAFERNDGSTEWYKNDRRHREDGPAVEDADGTKEWWLNGKRIKFTDYDSPEFKKRWQKLVELERVRQVMED